MFETVKIAGFFYEVEEHNMYLNVLSRVKNGSLIERRLFCDTEVCPCFSKGVLIPKWNNITHVSVLGSYVDIK